MKIFIILGDLWIGVNGKKNEYHWRTRGYVPNESEIWSPEMKHDSDNVLCGDFRSTGLVHLYNCLTEQYFVCHKIQP